MRYLVMLDQPSWPYFFWTRQGALNFARRRALRMRASTVLMYRLRLFGGLALVGTFRAEEVAPPIYERPFELHEVIGRPEPGQPDGLSPEECERVQAEFDRRSARLPPIEHPGGFEPRASGPPPTRPPPRPGDR